jgi:hypothetical protein
VVQREFFTMYLISTDKMSINQKHKLLLSKQSDHADINPDKHI